MSLLAALLRLADVCDVSYQRDGLLFRLLQLPAEAFPHWAQLQFVEHVGLEAKGRAYNIKIIGRVPDHAADPAAKLVETMAARWIRAEISLSRGVLARYVEEEGLLVGVTIVGLRQREPKGSASTRTPSRRA